MQYDTETLAFAILACVHDNDLDGLRTLLTHPLARKAVGLETTPWENPGCLTTAYRYKKSDFVVALLPYCGVQEAAHVFTECLTNGDVDMSAIIVAHREDIVPCLDPHTLSMLAGLCDQPLELPMGFRFRFNPTRQRAALQWFLDWAPEDIVQQQLHEMKIAAQQNPDTPAPFGLVEDMLAEQQKKRLEQEIDVGREGVGRKM